MDAMKRAPRSPDTVKVLHVDDQEIWIKLARNFLLSLSDAIRIRGETNPERAIERLSSQGIDCVVCDYDMSAMDGVAFLQAVRRVDPNMPVIFFTSLEREELAYEATDAEATAYVQKGDAEVYEVLATQIEQRASENEYNDQHCLSDERLVELYERTDGVYVLDDNWTVRYWNPEMVDRTGWAVDEVLGARLWELFPDAVDTELHEQLQSAMTQRATVEFDVYAETAEDWVEVRASPIEEGLVVYSREITAEKQRAEELRRRNQILESFANTVSHDFRNPLSVAQGRLELAKETGDFTHLEEVAMAHNRMRYLIDDLLELARQDDLELVTVSLRECATQAWETVSAEQTTLVVKEDLQFEAYKSQLRRLFENLYWNAVDHGEATEIRVGMIAGDGFYVEDNGSGIPSEAREEIFSRGYTTSEEGTGYGLHIVESLVEMHDWTISVREGMDSGARFEIREIPLAVG